MKEFQNTIQHYLLDHEKQKKYLAVVLALSMLVTFIVPLILMQSAESMTWNHDVVSMQLAQAAGNETIHPESCTDAGCTDISHAYSEVDLLVGKNSELRGVTVEETIRNANATYAIGIASQFCVFLDGDFTTTDADAEGRVAVSGSVDGASWNNNTWYYEIGNGDWYTRVGLDVLLDDSGYAHVISNGSNFQHVNVSSGQAPNNHPNWEVQGKHYSDANGNRGAISKRLQVGTNTAITGYNDSTDMDHFYRTDTFNVAEQFGTVDNKGTLLQRSEKLSQNAANGEITFGEISDNGSTVKVAYLTYTGTDPNAESIFFNFTETQWAEFVECTHVKYQNIPLLDEPREVVENDGSTSTWDTAYIVINVPGTEVHLANPNTHNGQKFTSITAYGSTEETWVSRTGTGDNDYSANNHPGVSSLLYNFYQADKLVIANNFQGTLLAPMAHATDEYTEMNSSDVNMRGHLSGALIAKSFNGATEFGYRPYTGPISILGSTSGYTIPVDKFKTDGTTPLPGADFSLTISDENGTVVTSWKSGDDTEYVTIPTLLDFTGGVTYTDAVDDDDTNNLVQSRTYTVKEVLAPPGYLKTEKTYTLTVTETVNLETLLDGENGGTIPTNVNVEITITPEIPDGETNVVSTAESTLTFSISDVYDEEAQTMRKITIGGKQFWLVIKDQKVAGMVQPTGEMETSNYEVDGTTSYTESTECTSTTVHYYTEYETATTEIESESDGAMITTAIETDVPKTVTETTTSVVTDENGEIKWDAETTTVEVEVISSSVITGESIESNSFTSYYDDFFETTYTETTSVAVTESLVDPAVLSTSGVLEFGNDTGTQTKYYFDPNSLILMPLPAQNLNFINEYGFVFEKTDEDLKPITGATIILEKMDGTVVETITSSSITVNPDTLDANTLYRFRESVVPSGYEEADPIYVVKFTDGSIAYFQSETEPTDIPTSFDDAEVKGWARFQINENYTRTIQMIDQKIHGYKLVLNKADAGTGTLLNGAYFKLCAANNDVVYPKDNPNTEADESKVGFKIDGTLDLFEVLKNAAEDDYDTNYVEDGYLKKGTYYLLEVKAPGGYETPSSPFRFKINYEDGEYSLEILSSDAPQYFTVEGVSTSWANEVWAYVSATDVTKIEIQVASPEDGKDIILYQDTSKVGYNLHEKRATVVNGVATFEFENALSSIFDFKIANGDNWSNGVTVTEVRIYGTESDGSSSGSGSTSSSDPFTIQQIIWSHDANNNNIGRPDLTLTAYYSDGTTNQKTLAASEFTVSNQYWAQWDVTGIDLSDIIGLKITVSGSNSGYKLVLKDWTTGSEKAYTYENVYGGQIITLGNTSGTASTTAPETTTPSDETTTAVVNAAPLETNTDGELVIPNSQLGANVGLTVQKDWLRDEGYEFARPSEIEVELYRATSLEDVAAETGTLYKTITLNAANGWAYSETVQRLINPGTADTSIYYYYVKEINVPDGYEVSYENNDGETVKDGGIIHIENTLKTITINVNKQWNPSGVNTSSSVTVKLQYSADGETNWTDLPNSEQVLNVGNNWTCKYEGLPSKYFYKAVEVVVPNGWSSEESAKSNTNGDTLVITNTLLTGKIHVTKKWVGDEAKHRPGSVTINLYRTTVAPGTGSGGGSAGGGSAEGDTTGGNTEVAENAVVARFLYQKGNGSVDHDQYWGPPEDQPSRTDQMYWTTNSASDIAANYAAALAQFAVNFPGDAKSENYLNAAKALYDFSTEYNSRATDQCSGFYPSTSCTDEQAWAAAWLYLATNDTTYKTACESKLSACGDPEQRGYFWDDVMLGAEAVYAAHIDDTPSWTKVTNYLNTYCTDDDFRVLNQWGSARHNALLQTLALVTDKNMGTTQYQEWCKDQMSIILGNNTYGTNGTAVNFVIGFADNAIKNPHHKAASGLALVNGTDWSKWNSWNGVFGEESHVLVGALASGPRNGSVSDNCKSPEGNEVALDYNAGLVGAAAGLYSVYSTGTLVNNGADIDSEVESKYDGFTVTRQPTYTSNITEDYSRLLQYSLYFYDANMCGDFTEENSAFSWRSACHTDDEVDGGFHDAGDHVMFGLPQGFSASTLGWVYYEFKDSFDSLGQTAHYKTIMEEFCDFFVDSIEFEEPSQQTLTLNNTLTQTQSQKASAIKGISQVGSEKVAKDSNIVVKDGYPNGYVITPTNNVTEIQVRIDSSTYSNGVTVVPFYIYAESWSHNGGMEVGPYNMSSDDVWEANNMSITASDVNGDILVTFTLNNGGISSYNPIHFTSDANRQNVAQNPITISGYELTYSDGTTFSYGTFATPEVPELTITADKTTLNIGETVALNPDSATYSITSGDSVTISGNVVTAVKPGKSVITGTDGDMSGEIEINVNTPSITAPATITECTNGTITVGSLTGDYTVKFGETELTGSNHTYSFTAPNVTQPTDYTVAVLVDGAAVASTTVKVNLFDITQEGAAVSEGGGTETLNANAPATWSIPDGYSDNIKLTPSSDGMSCTVEGKEYVAGTITITAADGNGNTDTAGITMNANNNLTLGIVDNKTEVRVGETVTLSSNFASNVTFSFEPADLVEFDETTRQVKAIGAGTVTISASRYGVPATPVTLTIQDALKITGDNTMNIGDEQTLQIQNAIGNVTWELTSGSDVVEFDSATQKVKAIANGPATITATDDHDGAAAIFNISVELSAVDADIPSDAVWIADIKITGSGDSWSNNEVVAVNTAVVTSISDINLEKLPLTDGNGNTYYYYIEEILADGDRLVTDTAVYVPSAYVNGSALTENAVTDLSVTNNLKSEVESDGRMPSAGGEGTTWYYMAGAAMMLAGIAGYFVLKRKQVSER